MKKIIWTVAVVLYSVFFSNPNTVLAEITLNIVGELKCYEIFRAVDALDRYAYVTFNTFTNPSQSGLLIIDVAVPESPSVIGRIEFPIDVFGGSSSVSVSGACAYVACGASGLQIIDVANPASPVILSSLDLQDRVIDLKAYGLHLYVHIAEERTRSLKIFNISDPANPDLVGTIQGDRIRYFDLSGNYLCFVDEAANGSELNVADISTPSSPLVVGSMNIPREVSGMVAEGNHVYMTQYSSTMDHFLIIDISDPANPGIVGTFDMASNVKAGDASQSFAYVSTFSDLTVLNVATPSLPSLVGSVFLESYISDLAVSGSHVYVTKYYDGLQVVEIADLPEPEPDLGVSKTALPEPVGVGETLIYSIEVRNYGDQTATGVVLTDLLPEEVSFVSAAATQGSCGEAHGTVTCTIGDLIGGSSVTATITVQVLSENRILNTVHVEGNEIDPDLRNNSAVSLSNACSVDLSIMSLERQDPVREGYYSVYHATVSNKGNDPATGVTLSNILPSGVQFISASSTHGDCTEGSGILSCGLGDISSQTSAGITVVTRAASLGSLTNDITISGNEPDCFARNNTQPNHTVAVAFHKVTIDNCCCPSLDDDSFGNLHVSYSRGESFRYATNEMLPWGRKTVGGNGNIYAPTSDVAVDKSNNVHLLFGENSWDLPHYRLSLRSKIGDAWQDRQTLVTSNTGFWPVSMTVDDQDKLHVCFNESGAGTMDGRLKYFTNASGSWGSPIDLGTAYDHAAIATDGVNAHISYYSLDIGGPVYVTNSPDGVWKTPETVEPIWFCGQCEGMVTDIALDSSNRPHITYVMSTDAFGNEEIRYAMRNSDGSWSREVVDTGAYQSAGNAITVDPSDQVHLCYFHTPSGELRYATKTNSGWVYRTIDYGEYGWGSWQIDMLTDSRYVHVVYDDGYRIIHASRPLKADGDFDGVSDAEEDTGRNGGDGNNDGTPDKEQANVTSLKSRDEQYSVTIQSPDGTLLADVQAVDNPSPSDTPENSVFPVGFFEFTLFGINVGQCIDVILRLPPEIHIETFYKFGPTPGDPVPHWYDFTYDGQTGAEIFHEAIETRIVLHLCDGIRGDDDIPVNGIISDTGAPVKVVYDTRYVDGDGDCAGNSPCHSAIQSAVDAADAVVSCLIKVTGETYAESILLNTSTAITIHGGWDEEFTEANPLSPTVVAPTGPAEVPLTIQSGSINIVNLELR